MFKGLRIYFDSYPKIKAPIPSPETTIPDTNPFLPGKWLQPAFKGAGYKKPLPIPNPTPYKTKKVATYFARTDIPTKTIQKAPPIKITGLDPIYFVSFVPIGKKIVLTITIRGRTK